ncbi:MAG: branched-chain amino acid ABC transporter ATP-binding protein [Deltaproteobacteria bacterium SM23_61]|nr:MAG: branched-chain amino acid ABC transporter ATP-binding protein [Deltaproteobacteria bacterium SM23_61]
MLELKNVEVKYLNTILVLKGVNIQLKPGGFSCILGANGAGKTTTLKAISGLLRTEEGEVTDGGVYYEGNPIHKYYPEDIARMGILQVMEGRRLAEHLTVEENLKAGGLIIRGNGGRAKKDLDRVYGFFPRLEHIKNSTAGYCSGGEQQMIAMGRCLMGHPKIMLLDEPSMGLAPLLVREISGIARRINKEERVSILLVEQNAHIALELAEYGYILENGRIVLDGPAETLKRNEDVKEFYLGFTGMGARRSYRDVKHYKRRKRWLG